MAAHRDSETTLGTGRRLLVVVAVVLPTAAALLYFLVLDSSPLAPWAYSTAKVMQFCLPLFAVGVWWRARSRVWRPSRSLLAGALTGVVAALVVGGAYQGLAGSPILDTVTRDVAAKTADFGIDRPIRFLAMALFLSLVHSALEEYYWRGFVFTALERWLGLRRALWLSSLAFASHHVVIVSRFAVSVADPLWAFLLVLLASSGVLAGGLAWAWLYRQSGSLLASWISHVAADLAVMTVGYFLLWG